MSQIYIIFQFSIALIAIFIPFSLILQFTFTQQNNMQENQYTHSLSVKILIAFGIMSIGLTLFSLLATLVTTDGERSKYATLLLGAFQNLVVFGLAAIVTSKICYRKVVKPLKMNVVPSWKGIGMVVAVYVVSLPALNWLVDWNAHITFPDSMQHLYHTLKNLEDLAMKETNFLLQGNDFLTMMLIVLEVGVITGFGEEIFFRGAILGAFEQKKGLNIHISVWCVGILFSAFHFQFFGFFPRCFLGIWLGYLFLWSRSLWLPVIAHALNNGMVVIVTYLTEHNVAGADAVENIGVPPAGEFPLLALISTVLTVALIIATSKIHFRN